MYAYTTGTQGEAEESHSYAYGNAGWKDLLTEYDGQTITYDGIGNPLTYRDGMTFTWMRGRRLATLTKGGVNSSYTYDDNGIRTSKTVGGTKTTYYLNGSTILTQISGGTRLDFFYDAAGNAAGFKYNGETYYYTRNLQGDVTRIRDSRNVPVATYRYDSWGKVMSVGGNQTIAGLNPFRYRDTTMTRKADCII